MGPNPGTGVLTRREKFGHRKTYRREGHVKIEAEIAVRHLQAKGH